MLWTYADAIETLRDFLGARVDLEARRDIKRAIDEAYRELTNWHLWAYYRKQGRIVTVAQYTTGTVAFDYSGGSVERQLTLSSGTWPTWARNGTVLIASQSYEVAERISGTILQLSVNANPGEDIAAGTAYAIYRDTYPFPTDCLGIDVLRSTSSQDCIGHVTPDQFLQDRTFQPSPSEPDMFTIMGDPNYQGAAAVRFQPPPATAVTWEFAYKRSARPLVIEEESTGTVTNTAASTTVTGSGTAFTSAMIGSVIRMTAEGATAKPSAGYGDNPTDVERIITAVASTTSLTVDSAIATARAGAYFTISDPIDIEQSTMLTVFRRGCEKAIAATRHLTDRAAIGKAWEMEMLAAMGADNKFIGRRSAGPTLTLGPFSRMRLGASVE